MVKLNSKYLLLLLTCVLALGPLNFVFAQQFNASNLDLTVAGSISNPTSIQFGPDSKLYIANQDGNIRICEIEKTAPNSYRIKNQEILNLLKGIPNHNDDGSPATGPGTNKRQVTGIYVTGTAENPIIYAASNDARMGAGIRGDVDLCTNSGIVSRLYKENGQWKKLDLVRGLPHSEENHACNGIVLDEVNNLLLLAVGGMTNAGGPSKGFTYITEYALAACIVSIDLSAIEAMPVKNPDGAHPYVYDCPTLDDPTRPNNPDGSDVNDPFGGNDGLNQAKIIPGGPVQVYASGFRNNYKIVISENGNVYTIDNGANPQWGGLPENEGTPNVTNNYLPDEPGSVPNPANPSQEVINNLDGFELIGNVQSYAIGSYYGGHPHPLRANPAGAGLFTHSGEIDAGTKVWRTSKTDPDFPLPADWPPIPVEMANPVESDFQNPGVDDKSLITFNSSTNGFCEYTASNFSGAMKGDMLTCSYDGYVSRIRLNESGTQVLNTLGASKLNQDENFASGFGGKKPLDITAQGDDDVFPGTVWLALYTGEILVYEPDESSSSCTAANDPSLDEDNDGYSNQDEILNGTNPCSGASRPEDFDGDLVSDLSDNDDDNDGIPDTQDYFAIDKDNGKTTNLPVDFQLYNADPGTGFFGLGFTGLMCNNETDYLELYDTDYLVAGGAAGAITINETPQGDAFNNLNNQMYAFQFGINVESSTSPFVVKVKLKGPFFNSQTPEGDQSHGAYIGTGDQDNYIKIALTGNNGSAYIQVAVENNGIQSSNLYPLAELPENGALLQFHINPLTGTLKPRYQVDGSSMLDAGSEINLEGPVLQALQGTEAMAIGIIASSRNSTSTFNATWDFIEVVPESITGLPTSKIARVQYYPNPTRDYLYLSSNQYSDIREIKISTPAGTIIKSLAISQTPGGYAKLNISDLENGLYFMNVKFEDNENEEVIQVIKY